MNIIYLIINNIFMIFLVYPRLTLSTKTHLSNHSEYVNDTSMLAYVLQSLEFSILFKCTRRPFARVKMNNANIQI